MKIYNIDLWLGHKLGNKSKIFENNKIITCFRKTFPLYDVKVSLLSLLATIRPYALLKVKNYFPKTGCLDGAKFIRRIRFCFESLLNGMCLEFVFITETNQIKEKDYVTQTGCPLHAICNNGK